MSDESDRLGRKLAEIAAEAEAGELDQADRPLPPHVKVSHPNHASSRVLEVRLSPDEYEALVRIAEARDLPPSTVARAHLLGLIRDAEYAALAEDYARNPITSALAVTSVN